MGTVSGGAGYFGLCPFLSDIFHMFFFQSSRCKPDAGTSDLGAAVPLLLFSDWYHVHCSKKLREHLNLDERNSSNFKIFTVHYIICWEQNDVTRAEAIRRRMHLVFSGIPHKHGTLGHVVRWNVFSSSPSCEK